MEEKHSMVSGLFMHRLVQKCHRHLKYAVVAAHGPRLFRYLDRLSHRLQLCYGGRKERILEHRIISGQYELGTEEQQAGYRQLFGEEDIQYKFDLYFHWYNIVHELGHCLLEDWGIEMPDVQEEMYVNEFAVAYWMQADGGERMGELRRLLETVTDALPPIVPADMGFEEYFEKIWGTDQLNNAVTYGYFQLNSVRKAMEKCADLSAVLEKSGIEADLTASVEAYRGEVSAAHAQDVLECAVANLKRLNLSVPQIRVELVENPLIQCCR